MKKRNGGSIVADVKRVSLKKPGLIVVRVDVSKMSLPVASKYLQSVSNDIRGIGVSEKVLLIHNGVDVRHLPEKTLNALGWFRKDGE